MPVDQLSKNRLGLLLAAASTTSLLFSGCAPQAGLKSSQAGQSPLEHPIRSHDLSLANLEQAITEEAKARDREGYVDGWYFGEGSRVFKSGYGAAPPAQKARFALDYHGMLEKAGQNLIADYDSYVPYRTRSQFARQWWTKNDPGFSAQSGKMKVVWIHEALLDGSELFFRGVEKIAGDRVQSIDALAHDEEQKLVYDYAEDQGHRGSLSTQPR